MSHQSTFRNASEKLFFTAFCGLLIFGPLAFGAVEVWSRSVLEIASGVLLLWWAINAWQERRAEVRLQWPLLFLAGILLIAHFQLLAERTAYSFATAEAVRLWVALGIMGFLALQLFASAHIQNAFVRAMGTFAFLYAAFALIQDFTSKGKLYWTRIPEHGGSVFGSYVNHNHFAGLMEMLLPFPLMLALNPRSSNASRAIWGFVFVVCGTSIVLSQSRGGMIAALVSVAVVIALLTLQPRHRKMAVVASMCLLLATGAFLLLVGNEQVANRWRDSSGAESDLIRRSVSSDAVRMMAARPFIGWGAGSFANVHPRWKSLPTNRLAEHDENDYLETLAETGIMGGIFLAGFVVTLLWSGRSLRDFSFRRDLPRLCGYAGCIAMLVHSAFDFNLRIPANAALFLVLASLAVSQVESEGEVIQLRSVQRFEVVPAEPEYEV
jgi:O-antigen ligase